MSRSRVDDYLARAAALEPLIRAHAARSERESRLAPEIADALHDAGLYRIMVPESLGGGGLTIPESLRVFERVAQADASAGWNLAICADGPLFGQFVAREAFEEIYADPRGIVVGSLNPMGTRAVPCEGGWRLSGRGAYLSGNAQASWVMVAGLVIRDGKPSFPNGAPEIRAALLPIRHCKFEDTWNVTGMRGTGSHDCTFEEVFVPESFTYSWPDPVPSWDTGPFGRIPLTTQLGGALASVAIGATQHVLDAFAELAGAKVPLGSRGLLRERPFAQTHLAEATGLVRAGRLYVREANDEVWRRGAAGEPFDLESRASARLASVTAVRLCLRAVDLIHDVAGMNAIQQGNDVERGWRDLHTMSQHVILGTTRFEVVGRIMLGLEPNSPMI